MNKYEAMFIVKPGLSEEESKTVYATIKDVIAKNGGTVLLPIYGLNEGAWPTLSKNNRKAFITL